MITQLEKNKNGKDFITTDLHGNLSQLKTFIKNQKLGKEDRIFISGDLIDRGSESYELVMYLIENDERYQKGENVPKIHVTLGNHEGMFLCWFAKEENSLCKVKKIFGEPYVNRYNNNFISNRENWVEKIEKKDLRKIYDYFIDFPIIIRVGEIDEKGAFNIVHADLPCDMSKLLKFSRLTKPGSVNHALWSRDNQYLCPSLLKPEGHGVTYCGHTNIGVPFKTKSKDNCHIYNLDIATPYSESVVFMEHSEAPSDLYFVKNRQVTQGIEANNGNIKYFFTAINRNLIPTIKFEEFSINFSEELSFKKEGMKKYIKNYTQAHIIKENFALKEIRKIATEIINKKQWGNLVSFGVFGKVPSGISKMRTEVKPNDSDLKVFNKICEIANHRCNSNTWNSRGEITENFYQCLSKVKGDERNVNKLNDTIEVLTVLKNQLKLF